MKQRLSENIFVKYALYNVSRGIYNLHVWNVWVSPDSKENSAALSKIPAALALTADICSHGDNFYNIWCHGRCLYLHICEITSRFLQMTNFSQNNSERKIDLGTYFQKNGISLISGNAIMRCQEQCDCRELCPNSEYICHTIKRASSLYLLSTRFSCGPLGYSRQGRP